MLYDPKWQKQKTAFELETLVAWLKRQPARKFYVYESVNECLLARYFKNCGYMNAEVGSSVVVLNSGEYQELPEGFNSIAFGVPRTFGSALRRAKKMMEYQHG